MSKQCCEKCSKSKFALKGKNKEFFGGVCGLSCECHKEQKKCECRNGIQCYEHFKKEMEEKHQTSNMTITPTESTTRKALHDPDCYKIGGKKDCSLKGNGTNPKKFAGCYETYVPTNPDLFADASKKYEEWEEKVLEYCFRICPVAHFPNPIPALNASQEMIHQEFCNFLRQEKEKSYQVGCKFGIDMAEKQFEAGRHSAYREMEEAAETDFQRLIIKNLKAKLIQK